ncbi:copper(I)-binding protein [Pelomonas saccharophila]|uniref:Copper(I)-binding protein n=1 Tax=Roseateles saccharophilus TaxID=304 RepID=A0ABU1YFQ0_ROSSA|nr:copper chaperone PCu(A)C [Roseateles saccharophilus]MDR7267653.1 copper(I)-binding protein [Roseateles saccharophilus]
MPHPALPRRHLLLAASAAYFGLARPAKACEFFSSHLRIWHPWTRSTRVDADTARLCMRFDEVQKTDRLVGIETPVAAGVRLAGPGAQDLPLLIRAGETLALTEDGLHLELLDLQQPLQIGRSYPLRLIFEFAEPVNATLNVDFGGLR